MRQPITTSRLSPWWWCALLVVVSRLVASDAQLDWDEELYWQVGETWRNGGTPYVDVFDHKPPLLYVLQLVYSGFSGSIWVLRVVSTFVLAGSAAFFARCMWPGRGDLEGMMMFAVLLTLSSFGLLGANSEILYAPYLLLTAGFLVRRALLPAVLTATLAINIKYTVGLDVLGVVVFVVLAGRASRREALTFLASCGALAVVTWVGFYGYFRNHGVDLVETTVLLNLLHAGGGRRPFAEALGTFAVTRFLIVSAALAIAAYLPKGAVDRSFRRGLLAWAALSLIQATVTGKMYYHYFTPVYLPLCILVVAQWERPTHRKQQQLRSFGIALGLVFALVLLVDGAALQRNYAQAQARLESGVCPTLQGEVVYVADHFLATYRICDIAPSKYMFPPFLFRPHYVALAGSRGLDELEHFDKVVVVAGSRFDDSVSKHTHPGIVRVLPAQGLK